MPPPTGRSQARRPDPMGRRLASILLGAALALGSPVGRVVTLAFAGVVDRGFMAMEERILEDEFGGAYRAYRARVRRWI